MPATWAPRAGLLPPRLAARVAGPELMDAESGVSREELEDALRQLRRINRLLGGHATTRRALDDLVARVGRPTRTWTVLDVGGGSGDAAPAILAWGAARGVDVRVVVIDRDERTAAVAARRLAGVAGAQARAGDLFDEPATSVDVVHAALVLHHFDGDDAAVALRRMVEVARVGVVVNDLRRGAVPWTLIRVLTAVLSRNRLIRHDAPLSVARAFVAEDWRRLAVACGLELTARRSWAWRWAVTAVRR